MSAIDIGNMVFLREGSEGIGAVRELRSDGFSLYVENGGEFFIPLSAVVSVHDGARRSGGRRSSPARGSETRPRQGRS